MITRYKTRAFVFKKSDINESDRMFSVFTDDFGRLDIFAKAIRKITSKLRNGIDVFFLSEIEFIQGKNKKTLTDAIVIKKFSNIAQDLEKLKIVNQIGEILDNFIKGEEKDGEIFSLINETFIKLNNFQLGHPLGLSNFQFLYYYFLWNALSLLGYHSEVYLCASCHEKLIPYDIYFSSEEGGVICKKCSSKNKFVQKINSDIVKILRLIFKKDWDTLSRLKIEQGSQKFLKDISDNYYSYILSSNSFKNN
jgi:DNA repair protein RecO (recombination protein O)